MRALAGTGDLCGSASSSELSESAAPDLRRLDTIVQLPGHMEGYTLGLLSSIPQDGCADMAVMRPDGAAAVIPWTLIIT